jgi:hypothetical protein
MQALNSNNRAAFALFALALFAACQPASEPGVDPLPSWNAGATKSAIVDFVARVTDPGSPHFVPVPERIATIVSGGGIDFMRVFAESAYGIPPEQVVGSALDAKYELRGGIPTIVKAPSGPFVDDKAGKPVGIYRHIGRRPIFPAGNSDGDQQMLEYTTIARSHADRSARFGLLVHHTDAGREWAYDRASHIGQLKQALDAAPQRGWVLVDMKKDWNRVYRDSGK